MGDVIRIINTIGGTITGDVIFTGNVTVQGNLDFGDVGTDVLTIAGYIQGSAAGNTAVKIGNGTPSSISASTFDLYVTEELEVDGVSFLNSHAVVGARLQFGTSNSFASNPAISGATDATGFNDRMSIYGGPNNIVCFVNNTNVTRDYNIGAQTHPLALITSGNAVANQYGSLQHDGNRFSISALTGSVAIGTGTPGSLTAENGNDLYITGQLEVDGVAYFDLGSVYANDQPTAYGTSSDARIEFSTAQTSNALMIGVPATSNSIILAESADVFADYDFAHALQTNPTLFIHSANQSTTEWGSLAHDQTDFVINQGSGTTKLAGGVTHNLTTVNAATYDLLISDYLVHVTYTGTGAVTSLTLPTAQALSGRFIIIKDAGGNAATNNITIDTEGAETIDGSATLVINSDYSAIMLYSDGSNWFIL